MFPFVAGKPDVFAVGNTGGLVYKPCSYEPRTYRVLHIHTNTVGCLGLTNLAQLHIKGAGPLHVAGKYHLRKQV
jgi:hypothetical protein